MARRSAARAWTPTGDRCHQVHLQQPGVPVPDGDGGYTESLTDLMPAVAWASIQPASAADLERVAAGTVIAQAAHVVCLPYHPQVTTATRLTFNARVFEVVGVRNLEERNRELVLVCVERVP